MKDDTVFCPLVDKHISIDDCMENKEVKEKFIPPEYKEKPNWKEICNGCKYQKY